MSQAYTPRIPASVVVDYLISGDRIQNGRDREHCPRYWKSIFVSYMVQVGHPSIDSGPIVGKLHANMLPIDWQVPIRRNQ